MPKRSKRAQGITGLYPKKLRAIEMYLGDNKSWSEVASAIGVTRTVLYKWRTEDEKFIKELNRQHAIHVREIASRTAANFGFCDAVLRKIAADESNAPKDRIDAAEKLQSAAFRKLELLLGVAMKEEFGDRIAMLENQAKEEALFEDIPMPPSTPTEDTSTSVVAGEG